MGNNIFVTAQHCSFYQLYLIAVKMIDLFTFVANLTTHT